MSDLPADSPDEVDDALATVTPGERIRAAREAMGLSLKDIASQTHQSVDTLRALESMNTQGMSPTVIRMHATRYAKTVGLPETEIADAFAGSRAMMSVEGVHQAVKPKSKMGPKLAVAGVALALLAIGGASLVWLMSGSDTDVGTIPVSTRVMPSTSSAAVYDKLDYNVSSRSEFGIRAQRKAWIEVRASDGTIFRSRNMSKGEVYFPRMDAGWTMTVKDASAFEIMLGGQQVMPVGEQGPLYSVSIESLSEQAERLLQQKIADTSDDNAAQSR